MSPSEWALLALFTPAAAALVLAVVVPLRRSGRPAAIFSIAAGTVSLVSACALLWAWLTLPLAPETLAVPWLPSGGNPPILLGVHVDGVSVAMLGVVALVALCVQVFSYGYLHDEPAPSFGRYYTYQSLFLFSMLLLVLAPNLLQLFIGWELVGVTSYLLIGYWYKKPSAARAAIKAFWVTKLADMGFVAALVLLYRGSGGFEWTSAPGEDLTTVITLCLFLAVVGKSAQFPLHVWLPDAMEGPTPVSALLHAATMVAAGVFLIVRADPMFAHSETTRMVMAHLGAATALFAAIIAVVQTDIKKVLAYSTCSQLGYMIAALGAGSMVGGFFHLTTHAFFKALLFLAAGSVIHAVGSNELSDMGGLSKKMKLTTAVFIIGAAALAGVPGFSGFFSKEMVLAAVEEQHLWAPLVALLAAAFLTAFYMGRVIMLAFFGEPSEKAAHAHEAPPSMAGPLVLLAVPALVAGFGASGFAKLVGEEHSFHFDTVGMIASALAISGLALAWYTYKDGVQGEKMFAALAPIGRLARSGAVDRFYLFGYRSVLLVGAAVLGWIDRYVVDGLMNLVGWAVVEGGRAVRKIQSGDVGDYVFALVAGAILLAAWGIWR